MKKTITEAFIIVLITVLLSLAYCAVSPLGRILLKKGLRVAFTAATPGTVTEGRRGI